MDLKEPETLQVRVEGLNVREFVDQNFLELLEKEFGNIKAINLALIVADDDDEKRDMITISHPFIDLEKENKAVIDVNEPLTLQGFIKVLESYKE